MYEKQRISLINKFIIILIAIMLLQIPILSASDSVKVVYFEKKPYIFTAEDGSAQGFAVDILNDLAVKQKWNLKFIKCTVSQSIEKLVVGEADLMFPLAYTKERDEKIDFSGTSLFETWGCLFTLRKGSIKSFYDVESRRIAYIKKSMFLEKFNDLTSEMDIKCEFVEVENHEQLFKKIAKREVDGGLGDPLAIFSVDDEVASNIDNSIIFNPFPVFIAAAEGDPKGLLNPITKYISQGKSNPNSYLSNRKKHWLSQAEDGIHPSSIALLYVSALLLLVFAVYSLFRIPFIRRAFGMTKIVHNRVSTNILVFSILFSILIWFTDVLMHLYSYDDTTGFIDAALMLNDPKEIIMRLIIVSVILLGGILTSRIFARLATQHALTQKQEEHLRTTLNSIGDAVIVTDIKGNIVRMNPVAEALTGWKKEDSIDKPLSQIFNIINSQTGLKSDNPVTQVLEGGKIQGLSNHNVLISEDGNKYQIAESAAPIIDEKNNITGVVLVFRDVSEEFNMREEIKENEEKYRFLVEKMNDGLCVMNANGILTFVNEKMCKMIGYTEDEMTGQPILNYFNKANQQILKDQMIKRRNGESGLYEIAWTKKDGNQVSTIISATSVSKEDEVYNGSVGIVTDITERILAEQTLIESQEKYSSLFHRSIDGIIINDMDGTIFDANEKAEDLFGYNRSELLSIKLQSLYPKHSLDRAQNALNTIQKEGSIRFEIEFVKKNGETFPAEVSSSSFELGGRKVIQGIIRDITERKEAEKDLADQKQKLSNILIGTNVGTWEWNIQTGETVFNERWAEIIGYSLEELSPVSLATWEKYAHPDDIKRSWELLEKHLKGEIDYYECETRMQHKNGDWIWIHDKGKVTNWSSDGKPIMMYGTHQDITERKNTEDIIKASEARLKSLIEARNESIWSIDKNYRLQTFNEFFKNDFLSLLYIELKQGMNILNILSKEQSEFWRHKYDKVLGGEKEIFEFFEIMPNGRQYFRVILNPIFIDNTIKGVSAISYNITEQKQAEEDLRESQNRFKQLSENVHVAFWLMSINESIEVIYANPAFEKIWGINREQLYNDFSSLKKSVPETYWDDFPADLTQLLGKDNEYTIEHQIILPDDSLRWVYTRIVGVYDESGAIYRAVGISHDITERKRAEQKIHASNMMLDNVINTIPVRVFWKDINGNFLGCNKLFARDAGRETPDSLIGDNDFNMAWADQAEQYRKDDKKIIQTGQALIEYEEKQTTPDGQTIWLSTSKIPLRDSHNNIYGILGTYNDITERKQSEEALIESEEKFRLFMENAHDGVLIVGENSRFEFANRKLCKILGYSLNEIIGQSFTNFLDDDSKQLVYDRYVKRQKGEDVPSRYEFKVVTKNGEFKDVEISSAIIKNFKGEVKTIATLMDITESKRVRQQLIENFNSLQAIYNSLPITVFSIDENGVFTLFKGNVLKTLGFESGQVVGNSVFELFKENKIIIDKMKMALKGEICEYESIFSNRHFYTYLVPFFAENKKVKGINGLALDVTEKKKTEEEIKKLRNYLSNIINSMPSMLVGVDSEGFVTQWNNTAEHITGINETDAHGKLLSDILPQMKSEIEKIKQSIKSRQIIQEQKRTNTMEKETLYEDMTIFPLITNGVEGAVIRIDDVTQKVRMEEMMIQSEKMLSVGGLAAGMAHEINNPLAGMMQTAEVMANRLKDNIYIQANIRAAEEIGTTMEVIEQFMNVRGIPRMIDAIVESGKRVAKIVDNMLSFSRKSEAIISPRDLEDLLDKTLELARTDYDLKKHYDFRKIKIKKEYAGNLPTISCEGAKIQQVLLNIFRNGAQAMQESKTKAPLFTIRTEYDSDRKMAIMKIADNGPGMDEATRFKRFLFYYCGEPQRRVGSRIKTGKRCKIYNSLTCIRGL